jgi:hypothetical protein
MTPGAIRLKETVVQWRRVKVVTLQSPDSNLLRRYSVFVANEAGDRTSLTASFATETAANLEHSRLVRQLTTGERTAS